MLLFLYKYYCTQQKSRTMVNPNRFYTYAYLREDRTPYYIGKGCGKRIYTKKKNEIHPPKDKSRIIFLKQNLTEEEAFKHEIYMIAVFGRKDLGTGILHNRTNGGSGGAVLFGDNNPMKRDENKEKIRQFLLNNHPMRGKTITEEQKKLISKSCIERKINVGEKSHLSKCWKLTFENGKEIAQTGLRRWGKDNGYSADCLYKMAKGNQQKHKDIIKIELI